MYPVHIVTQELVGAKFQHWFLGKPGQGGGVFSDGGSFSGTGSTGGSSGGSSGSLSGSDDGTSEPEPNPEEITSLDSLNVGDVYAYGLEYTKQMIQELYKTENDGEKVLNSYSNVENASKSISLDSRYNNMDTFIKDMNSVSATYKVYQNGCKVRNYSDELTKTLATGYVYEDFLDKGYSSETAKAMAYIIASGENFNNLLTAVITNDLLNSNIPLASKESLNTDSNTDALEIEAENFSTTYSGENCLKDLEEMGISIEKLSNFLDIQIPLADEVIEGDYVPAAKFISWEQSPFNVKGFNQDLSGNGSVSLYDALKYKDANGKYIYAIVVEPLFWAGMYASSTTYEAWYTLGTYYNIVQYYVERLGNTRGSGCHYGYLTLHGKNCMTVSKDLNDYGTGSFKIKAATDSARMNLGGDDGILSLMNDGYGYGMHLYYGGDFQPSSSSTSTYDEPQSVPAKSEDCTSKPEETDYGTKSKTVSIVKAYETIKSDGTIQNDGYFIRTKTPHTIAIEDEDAIGYTVVDWQTSTENNIPYGLTESHSGRTDYTYEQLITNSTKNQSGTNAGSTVILNETEKILYVKLQRAENTPPNNLRQNGSFILRESEIARAVSTKGDQPDTKGIALNFEYNFPDISLSSSSHNSHTYNERDVVVNGVTQYNADGSVKKTHDDCSGLSSFSDGSITDNKVEVRAKNKEESNYSNIIVQSNVSKFHSIVSTSTLYRSGTSAETKTGSHVYYFTLFRTENGEDTLKLASYNQKQSSNKDVTVGKTQTISSANKDTVKTLSYGEANSKTTKTRASVDYAVSVTFKFIFDTSSPDKSTAFQLNTHTADCGHSEGGNSTSKDVTSTTEIEESNDIAVQVYSGTNNKPLHTKLWTESTGKNGEKYLPIRDNNNKTVGNI